VHCGNGNCYEKTWLAECEIILSRQKKTGTGLAFCSDRQVAVTQKFSGSWPAQPDQQPSFSALFLN